MLSYASNRQEALKIGVFPYFEAEINPIPSRLISRQIQKS